MMLQFLYQVRPTRPAMLKTGPTTNEARVIDAHFAYLRDLVASGTVLLAGRTLNDDESAFGIVILIAACEDDARQIMREDPAVKNGVMNAELFPYRLALWSSKNPLND